MTQPREQQSTHRPRLRAAVVAGTVLLGAVVIEHALRRGGPAEAVVGFGPAFAQLAGAPAHLAAASPGRAALVHGPNVVIEVIG